MEKQMFEQIITYYLLIGSGYTLLASIGLIHCPTSRHGIPIWVYIVISFLFWPITATLTIQGIEVLKKKEEEKKKENDGN